MAGNSQLITDLKKQIEQWQALAAEARQRVDQHRRGDLDPAYLYGCADQLERNASAIRELIVKHKLG